MSRKETQVDEEETELETELEGEGHGEELTATANRVLMPPPSIAEGKPLRRIKFRKTSGVAAGRVPRRMRRWEG